MKFCQSANFTTTIKTFLQDQAVSQDLRESEENVENLDLRDQVDNKVPLDLKDLRDKLDQEDHLDHKDSAVNL